MTCSNIRVRYASGHSIIVGPGDYLPVGCNVVGYDIVEQTFAETKGLFAHSPSCAAAHPTSCAIFRNGAAAMSPASGTTCLGCGGTCPVDCSATNPGKPNPGSHPNPQGDDDGDGVRNECDPDEVACVDADSDGCCDHCGDECGPEDEDADEDDDDDGVRNECDPDSVACEDADSDGCCDFCDGDCGVPCDPETDCCEGEPGYPECDEPCDPETDCCEGEPGYPECCDPEVDCCPGEEGYPDCPDDCEGCDPCATLAAINATLQNIESGLEGGSGGYTPVKPPIDPVYPGAPPDGFGVEAFEAPENILPETIPEFGSPTGGHLTIPVPGIDGEGVALSFGSRPLVDFAQPYIPSGALGTATLALDTLRQTIRLVLLALVSWSFCRRVYVYVSNF